MLVRNVSHVNERIEIMATSNDITGDSLISRVNSKSYEDNYDKIFGSKKKKEVDDKENVKPSVENLHKNV